MGRSCERCYPLLTAHQMRMADQQTIEAGEASEAELMERAGRAIADAVIRCAEDGGRVVIVAGPGSNGGDGLVAARLLRNRRIPVTAIPLVAIEQLKGETARQAELAQQAGVKVRPATSREDLDYLEDWLKRAVIVVDAIFGTGLTRPVEGWVAEAMDCINRSDRAVLAVDIASGIHADSGERLGAAVKADFTVPIAAYKWGHWLGQGRDYIGNLQAPAPIGIGDTTLDAVMARYPSSAACSYLINEKMIEQAFPARRENAHKNEFGHVWVLGGSQGYTGAPRLAAAGAQAVGAGLVSIGCPDDVYPIVAASSLEVMVHPLASAPWQQANSVVAGPGWGREQREVLAELLRSGLPAVLDADALNMVADDSALQTVVVQRNVSTVLTPHAGEAGRLLGITAAEVQRDRLAAALALVAKYECWVVLKGAQTLVVSPARSVWLSPFGSPKLAVAGTGDVLAGMLGGLLAGGIAAEVATPAAVALHAMAGEEEGWHRAGELEDIVVKLVQSLRR